MKQLLFLILVGLICCFVSMMGICKDKMVWLNIIGVILNLTSAGLNTYTLFQKLLDYDTRAV